MKSLGTFHRRSGVAEILVFLLVIGLLPTKPVLAGEGAGVATLDMKHILLEYMKFPEKVKIMEMTFEQDASSTELMKPVLVFDPAEKSDRNGSPSKKIDEAETQDGGRKQMQDLMGFMEKTMRKKKELLEKFKETLLEDVQMAIQKVGAKYKSQTIINSSPVTSRELEQILLSGLGSSSSLLGGSLAPKGLQNQPPNGFLPPTIMGGGGPSFQGGVPGFAGPPRTGEGEKTVDVSYFSRSVIFSIAPDLTDEVLRELKEKK